MAGIKNSNLFSSAIGLGIGEALPTALAEFAAGTADAGTAPIKLAAGTLLSTPEAGAVEFDGTSLYYTNSIPARKKVAVVTAPVDSSVATAAFGNTLTYGAAKQNTTGYNLFLNITVTIGSVISGNVIAGVGSTSSPGTDAIISTTSFSSGQQFIFSAYVPNGYYVIVNSTGLTIISSISVQAMAM